MKISIKLLIDDGSKKGKLKIYAENRTAKPSMAGMAGPLIFLCLCARLIGLDLIIGVPLAFGLYYFYKRGIEAEQRELAEFRKKRTVNGLKARQVHFTEPRDYRWIVIVLGFPISYYLHDNLGLTGTQFSIAFPAVMIPLLWLNIYARRLRMGVFASKITGQTN